MIDINRAVKILNNCPWGLTVKVDDYEMYFPISRAKANKDYLGNDVLEIYVEGVLATSIEYRHIDKVTPGNLILK